MNPSCPLARLSEHWCPVRLEILDGACREPVLFRKLAMVLFRRAGSDLLPETVPAP